jgi:hypothetical protein
VKLDPPEPDVVYKVLADQSPQEKSYHYIRFIVEDELHDHPEQASIVLRRLERDYEKLGVRRQAPSATRKGLTESRSSNKK